MSRLIFLLLFLPAMAFAQGEGPFVSTLFGAHYYGTPAIEIGVSRDRGFSNTHMHSGSYRAVGYTQSASIEFPYINGFDPLVFAGKYGIWFRKTHEKGSFSKKKVSKTDYLTIGANAVVFSDLALYTLALRPEIGFTFPKLAAQRKKWPKLRRFKLVYGYNWFPDGNILAFEVPKHQFSLIFFRERNKAR